MPLPLLEPPPEPLPEPLTPYCCNVASASSSASFWFVFCIFSSKSSSFEVSSPFESASLIKTEMSSNKAFKVSVSVITSSVIFKSTCSA